MPPPSSTIATPRPTEGGTKPSIQVFDMDAGRGDRSPWFTKHLSDISHPAYSSGTSHCPTFASTSSSRWLPCSSKSKKAEWNLRQPSEPRPLSLGTRVVHVLRLGPGCLRPLCPSCCAPLWSGRSSEKNPHISCTTALMNNESIRGARAHRPLHFWIPFRPVFCAARQA